MQNHAPLIAITPTEFNELLDEDFDNSFEIRRQPNRKKNVTHTHYIRCCDETTVDEQFEMAEEIGEEMLCA